MSAAEDVAILATVEVVGRDPELLVLRRFLQSDGSATCFVISGEAGIGKTTLWQAGLEMAEAEGFVGLTAHTTEAEVAFSFAAMADLVEGVGPDVLDGIPGPQLRALEVALRRRDPVGDAQDPFAISAGFLSVLRALTDLGPLLIAIDDVQWLDASSATALVFAARRLTGGRARFLLTRRPGGGSDLERVFQSTEVERLDLAPLTFGATVRVMSERFGSALTRRVLRRVHETSAGNPLFALELGRLLITRGIPEMGTGLPVPDLVDDVFGAHIRDLPDLVRRALLAVSLSAGMNQSELSSVVSPVATEDAISAGVLVVDRSRMRPAHPMLAAAARKNSTARERQALHRDLAAAIGEPTVRAGHLASATEAPDASVASIVAAASELAAQRGAVEEAAELGVEALRLTPQHAPELVDRLLALGLFYVRADELPRVTELLTGRMDEIPAGRARALAHLLLGEAADAPQNKAHVEQALVEAGDDPEMRALALAKKSRLLAQTWVERIPEAEAWALEGLAAAHLVGTESRQRVFAALAWARILQGCPVDDLGPSDPSHGSTWRLPESSIDRAIGARLTFRGQLAEARAIYRRLLALADDCGDVLSVWMTQHLLCELELRAGNVNDAARLLEEFDAELPWMAKTRARLYAVLAAVAGDPATTTRWAATALEEDSGHVQGWDRLEATRAAGLAAILEQDPSRAVGHLQLVWEHTVREHVDDPGAFPVAPDLVESLVLSGDVDSASDVTKQLRRLATEQDHPWGLASARRCAACVDLSDRYVDEAATAMGNAATDYGALGLHFDQGRTLLYLGGIQRRFLKRSGARRTLEEAAELFDRCGASGWAIRARAELARVSGRRSTANRELTSSERQVVDLAVSGQSNKEIASRLVVSVYTIEAHLSHAYSKLGIRSRAQLAQALRVTDER